MRDAALPLAATVMLLPLAVALPGAPVVVAGPGFGTAFDASGAPVCHGPLLGHASYLPGDQGQAGFDFFGGDAAGCGGLILAPGGYHALGVIHYDMNGPSASLEVPCTGSTATGLDCPGLHVGPFRGFGAWISIRTAGFEGWFLAL